MWSVHLQPQLMDLHTAFEKISAVNCRHWKLKLEMWFVHKPWTSDIRLTSAQPDDKKTWNVIPLQALNTGAGRHKVGTERLELLPWKQLTAKAASRPWKCWTGPCSVHSPPVFIVHCVTEKGAMSSIQHSSLTSRSGVKARLWTGATRGKKHICHYQQ
jgi:hypothetical protein